MTLKKKCLPMAEQTAVGSEEKPLKELAEDLIREQTTLTLATAHADKPWAAPVYYVYRRSVFYFFSDPKTRHIEQAMATGQAAAAISAPGARWQEIRGIQMVGRIEQVHGKIEALEAIRGYLKKFPFTKEFFRSEQKIDLEAFSRDSRCDCIGFALPWSITWTIPSGLDFVNRLFSLLEDLPGCHHPHDLVCACVDLGEFCIPHHALHRIVLHIPIAAHDLDRIGSHLHGRI